MSPCRLLNAAADLLEALTRYVERITPLPKPGVLTLTILSEVDNVLHFKIILPAPGAADVVSRELSVQIADGEAVVQTLAGSALEQGGFSGEDNVPVVVTLVDVDDAGNRSEAREQTFTLADTLAPPQPGEIGLVVESET